MNEDFNDIDKLVDFIYEVEEYLYSFAQIYKGEYNFVDHTNWDNKCMILFQKYHFDINKIKKDIINGTILLPINKEHDLIEKYSKELYKKHKQKAEEFENKYLL
jgi:hypothetical protein